MLIYCVQKLYENCGLEDIGDLTLGSLQEKCGGERHI